MDATALLNTVGEQLKSKFGEAFISSNNDSDLPTFIINSESILDIVKFLYEDDAMAFQYLTTLATIHYPDNKGEEFALMYQLHNLPNNLRIRLKAFVSSNNPSVPSITSVFAGANWMERQEFDFFGIKFTGHPNLKRILNMDDMNYHPMRKEYALEDGTREDKDDSMFGR